MYHCLTQRVLAGPQSVTAGSPSIYAPIRTIMTIRLRARLHSVRSRHRSPHYFTYHHLVPTPHDAAAPCIHAKYTDFCLPPAAPFPVSSRRRDHELNKPLPHRNV